MYKSMCDSDSFRKMNISSTYFTRVVIIQCFFLLLDPLDRREHKPVFLFLEIMYCTFGRIPHWYHSKCRLMSGNLFKHFLSIQKLSRHHAESVSDSVQFASIYPSYLNLSERESELNRCMKPMDLLDSGIYSGVTGGFGRIVCFIPKAKARYLSTAIL